MVDTATAAAVLPLSRTGKRERRADRGGPEGCHELDPAATPVDLLKVITEVKEDAAVQAAKIEESNSEH